MDPVFRVQVVVFRDLAPDRLKNHIQLFGRTILEESEEKVTYSEGCLSIPGIYCDVVRPKKMTVRYYNEDLQQVTEEFDNFAARMI